MEHAYITVKKELPESVYYPKFSQDEFLSASAKQHYIFLLEKTLNGDKSDELGRLYVEISLSKSIATIKRGLLDMEMLHLIERKRQGVGKVNRLYVLI